MSVAFAHSLIVILCAAGISGCHLLLPFSSSASARDGSKTSDLLSEQRTGEAIPPDCVDGIKDGAETDIDCGGGTCPPCKEGKICRTSTDCAGQSCVAGSCGPSYPPLPTLATERFGIEWSKFAVPDGTATQDKLVLASQTTANMKSKTIRLYLGVADLYGLGVGATEKLVDIARRQRYREVFENAQFTAYILDVATASDDRDDWRYGYTSQQANLEHDELVALGRHLIQTYPTKRFILLNARSNPPSGATALTGFLTWMEARARAVADARDALGGGKLYSGLEFDQAGCGTTENCIIAQLAPKLKVDYWAYASRSDLSKVADSTIGATLQSNLNIAFADVQKVQTNVTHQRFILSDYGSARETFGECSSTERTRLTMLAALAWGVEYAIYHQLFDAEPVVVGEIGMGLVRHTGAVSLPGQLLQTYYSTGKLDPLPSSCPVISGVTSLSGTSVQIGRVFYVFGSNFSSGSYAVNSVYLLQSGKRYPAPVTYNSSVQITATAPATMVVGQAWVIVANQSSVQSRAFQVSVSF